MPFGDEAAERNAGVGMNLGVGEPGMFAGFARGVGSYAMRSAIEAPRAISLLQSIYPIAADKLTGGTDRQDAYFAEHDAMFNSARDYWTPSAGEVGSAGQVVGTLLGTLPTIIANPPLGVGTALMSNAEDLTRAGASAPRAIGVGVTQAAALAAGLRMPVLGNNLVSRVATGGAGNVVQGIAASTISRAILMGENPKLAEGFNPLDMKERAIDLLMGMAFGGVAHIDARARVAVRAAFDDDLKSAILTLNHANQLEVMANAYKAAQEAPGDMNAKVGAIRQAVDQTLRGERVSVDDGMARMFETTPTATAEWQARVHEEAMRVSRETLSEVTDRNRALTEAQETPGFMRSPEQLVALRAGQLDPSTAVLPELARAIEISNKPGFMRTAEERIFLDSVNSGQAFDHMISQALEPITREMGMDFGLNAQRAGGEGAPGSRGGQGEAKAGGDGADAPRDPIAETARNIAQDNPDMMMPTGQMDAAGNPVTMPVGEYLAHSDASHQASLADANLFRTAITCMLGAS